MAPTVYVSTPAQHPFDIRSADVVIRTSDHVDFYLYKAVLALASPFFDDMFSIVQPQAYETSHIAADTRNFIPVTEASQTFDCLMRLCYPVDDPIIEDLPLLENVLEAAIKYQMSEATKISRGMLRKFVQAHPLDVYVISCRLHVEEEAQLAADVWKVASTSRRHAPQFEQTLVGASFGGNMETITAANYYCLLHYLRTSSQSTLHFTDGGNPIARPDVPTSLASSNKETAKPLHDTTQTDVILVSEDGVEFPVHSAVLCAASAAELMNPLLAELQPNVTSHAGSPPSTFPIDLPGDVLAELLRLCYPMERFNLADLSLLCSVYAAAEKWRITRITAAIRKEFHILIEQHPNPVSLYFIAVKQAWQAEAEHSARVIAQKGLQYLYAVEMEGVSATAYHHLLRFCHDFCIDAHSQLEALVPLYPLQSDRPPPLEAVNLAIVFNDFQRSSKKKCSHSVHCSTTSELLLDRHVQWEHAIQKSLSEVQLRWEEPNYDEGK